MVLPGNMIIPIKIRKKRICPTATENGGIENLRVGKQSSSLEKLPILIDDHCKKDMSTRNGSREHTYIAKP